jgi:cytolysin-activating lysine-acyltransferase
MGTAVGKLSAISGLPNGEALWAFLDVCIRGQAYRKWTLGGIERLFIPPIEEGLYRLYRLQGTPSFVAFCTWAWLDDEAVHRLRDLKANPRREDWLSGRNLWVIDLVSPFGMTSSVTRHLQQSVFAGTPLPHVFALRRQPDGQVRKIGRWPLLPSSPLREPQEAIP